MYGTTVSEMVRRLGGLAKPWAVLQSICSPVERAAPDETHERVLP
jgi:hypothetical protein